MNKLKKWKSVRSKTTLLDKPHTSIEIKLKYPMISKEEMTEKLDKIKAIVKEMHLLIDPIGNENSHIKVLKSDVDEFGTMTIMLCGGLNGHGRWENYFEDLANITKLIKMKYDCWVIKLENDCADDVFYVTFGIK